MNFFKRMFGKRDETVNEKAKPRQQMFDRFKEKPAAVSSHVFREVVPLSTVFGGTSIIRENTRGSFSVSGKIIIPNRTELPAEFGGYVPFLEGNYIVSLYKLSSIQLSTELRVDEKGNERTVNKLVASFSEFIPFLMFGKDEAIAIQNIAKWAKENLDKNLQLPPMERLAKEELLELFGSAQVICMNSKASNKFNLSKLLDRINDIKRASDNIWLLSVENVSIRITYMLINLRERRLARKNEPFTVPEMYDVDPRFMNVSRERLESMVSKSIVLLTKNSEVLVLLPFSKGLF